MKLEKIYRNLIKSSQDIYDIYIDLIEDNDNKIYDKNLLSKLKYYIGEEKNIYDEIDDHIECNIINGQVIENINNLSPDQYYINMILQRMSKRLASKAFSFQNFSYVQCYYRDEVNIKNFLYYEELDNLYKDNAGLDNDLAINDFINYEDQSIGICGRIGTDKTISEAAKAAIDMKILAIIDNYVKENKNSITYELICKYYMNLYLCPISEQNYIENGFKIIPGEKEYENKNNNLLYQKYQKEYISSLLCNKMHEFVNTTNDDFLMYFLNAIDIKFWLSKMNKKELDLFKKNIIYINKLNDILNELLIEIDEIQKKKVK